MPSEKMDNKLEGLKRSIASEACLCRLAPARVWQREYYISDQKKLSY
jgi:hypothetical protein